MSRGPKNFEDAIDKLSDKAGQVEDKVTAKAAQVEDKVRDKAGKVEDAVRDKAASVTGESRDMLGDLEQEFRKIWSSLQGMSGNVAPGAARVKEEAEDKLTQSPWISIGIIGLVAFVLGYMLGGRRSE